MGAAQWRTAMNSSAAAAVARGHAVPLAAGVQTPVADAPSAPGWPGWAV